MSIIYRWPSKNASYQVSIHFLEINQSETRIAFDGHVCLRIGTKLAIFIKDIPRMLPTKFRFIWQAVSKETIF